jgi:hypothetical protein
MTHTKTQDVITLDIEGQAVRCFVRSGEDRLWHCDCEYFRCMLVEHGEGFCPHVAVAISRTLQSVTMHVNEY